MIAQEASDRRATLLSDLVEVGDADRTKRPAECCNCNFTRSANDLDAFDIVR